MKINLSPSRSDGALALSRSGDVLTINGEAFDFSALPDGASLPASAISSPWFVGQVERNGGQLSMTLIRPHGPDASEADRFPATITLADGASA